MTVFKNTRLINALLKQPVDKTPVWVMRQAGRYLPEYRKIRASVSGFLELCQTPELACQVTLQPLARFDLDAAIIFSDILTVPAAMGMELKFLEGEGPKFSSPLKTQRDIDALIIPEPEEQLGYVMQAIRLTAHELAGKLPLIGFSGSPWTLAAYMIEGQGSKDFAIIKQMLYQEPQLLHQLLKKLAISVTAYLNAQIVAGANALMIFDTWGGILAEAKYEEFSLSYMREIIAGLTPSYQGVKIPVIVFTKNGGQWLEAIASSGCDAVGIDWTLDIAKARARIGDKVAIQGNLDPAVLRSSPEVIRQETRKILQSFGNHPGHIFNLGHGITPDILPEHVQVLVETVHE